MVFALYLTLLLLILGDMTVKANLISSDPIGETIPDPEQRLVQHLFDKSGYDKRIRPGQIVNGTKEHLSVAVLFSPFRIINLDDRLETITMLTLIEQRWHDPRLAWKPEDFGNITTLSLESGMVWRPVSFVSNMMILNREDKIEGPVVGLSATPARVTWGMYALVQDRCGFDMTFFPFDQQDCRVCMYSAGLKRHELIHEPVSFDKMRYEDSGEWILETMRVEPSGRTVSNTSMACLSMTLRRRSTFYIINLFLPTIIICILNTIGLFVGIDGEHGELDYADLGQTTLLSLSVLLLTIAEETPRGSSTVSLLGIFFLAMIFQTLLATMTAIYLKKYHRKAETATARSKMAKCGQQLPIICMVFHLGMITAVTVTALGIGFHNGAKRASHE